MKKLTFSLLILFIALAVASIGAIAAFNEAPQLRALVEKGELPPVEDRLPHPEDIYVVEPYEEIGRYGGVLRTATQTPTGYGDDNNLSIFTALLKPSADGGAYIPHLAKSVEGSEDTTTWTIKLRRGVRWSDGHPFTTDDIMFWYEDVLLNEDLTPVIGQPWRTDAGLVEFVKVDDYTLRITFPQASPFFVNRLVHSGAWNLIWPKHYLTQFHADYVPEDELNALVASEGFDYWYQLFGSKNTTVWGQSVVPDRPSLAPYILTDSRSDRRIWVRNPYYWKVDTAGNQLPYLDGIEAEVVSDVEVVQGMILSGQIDFAGVMARIQNYPMYRQFEEQGNYRTILWTSGQGSEVIYMVNQTHEDPAMREIFQDVRFRRALSVAIDRDEINETIYYGFAQPRQWTALESSRYYEPEFATAYTQYDPEMANQLLDEMGLDQRDSEGYRLRSDGQRLVFTIEFYDVETPKLPNVELVSQYWQEIGLDVRSRSISGELQGQRAPANLMDATIWHGDKASDILFPNDAQFVIPQGPGWERTIWPLWGRYFQTSGEEGEEPPDHIKELYGWWTEMVVEPDEDRQIELGKKIMRSHAENLWNIGTVGNAPYPIVINKDLRNFPEDGLWVWDTLWSMPRNPEQLFFDR